MIWHWARKTLAGAMLLAGLALGGVSCAPVYYVIPEDVIPEGPYGVSGGGVPAEEPAPAPVYRVVPAGYLGWGASERHSTTLVALDPVFPEPETVYITVVDLEPLHPQTRPLREARERPFVRPADSGYRD